MKLRKSCMSIIAVILCCVMSLQSFAFYPVEELSAANQDIVKYEGQTFSLCKEFDEVCDNIYLSNGQYVMEINTPESSVVIPVNRVDVKFEDITAVNNFMDREDVPKEAKASFARKYQAYMDAPDDYKSSPVLVMFEPDATGLSASGNPDNILYYTYNGWSMMTYQYIYTGLSTGWEDIKVGHSVKETVNTASYVLLTALSVASKKLSYFTSAESILSAFAKYFGISTNTVTTNREDYFQVRLEWDQTEQYTMTDFGGSTSWQTGLVTYKVKVKELGQETYFANTGKGPYKTDNTYNVTIQSAHFDNPWATAFSQGSYNTKWEYVSWSAGDVKYNFA